MTLKKYLNLMTILTLICWLSWVLVLFLLNPNEAGLIGFVLFYFSLFLSILGTISVFGFIIRVRLKKEPIFKQVEISFRQGIWFSFFIICLLLLKDFEILKWWNALILFLFLMFLEFFFISSRKKYKTQNVNYD